MIIDENILICTIIRNCESHVLNWYSQIKNYTSLLKSKNFSLSVYENDSTDNTKKILNSLDFSFLKNISIISENLNTEFYKTDFEKNKDRLTRVKNLSNARNKCLYNSNLNIDDYKKIIFIEPDFYFDFENFSKIVLCEERMGFKPDVFSGLSIYNNTFYDRWATRENNKEFWGVFSPSNEIVKVWSTFNGVCLYNSDPFKKHITFGWFNERINNYDCDTAVICENFIKNGYNKIYLDKSLVFIHKD